MASTKRERPRPPHLVCVAAVFLALTAVTAVAAPTATANCTRYAPAVFQPNTNCAVNGPMGGSQWRTPSTALRDGNQFAMVDPAQVCWQLWYDPSANNTASGCGTYGAQEGAAGYRYAGCSTQVYTPNEYGRCMTLWH